MAFFTVLGMSWSLRSRKMVAYGQHLVEDEHVGIDIDGDGEREPDEHAAGVRLDGVLRERADVGEVEDGREEGVNLLAGVPHAGADEADVLDAGELGVETAAQFKERGTPPRHEAASGGRLGNAGENFEKRGLSGAVATDDADESPLGYGEGDIA